MKIRHKIQKTANEILSSFGLRVLTRNELYCWQWHCSDSGSACAVQLPESAREDLSNSHERLKELNTRYSEFGKGVMQPLVWTDDLVGPDEILSFRGDNAYVWQLRGANMNILAYALTYYYARSIDEWNLLGNLMEDQYFGTHTFEIDNRKVSRDLLDSVLEIYFLERNLEISKSENFSILDIGAGYGRLGHRMANALPNLGKYLCTDAVAVSTFISEYYTRFRNVDGKVKVVCLDEVEDVLREESVDLAVNIHSFSECRLPAIRWWVDLIAKNRVKNLMIVPNKGDRLLTNDGLDFSSVIEDCGYRSIVKEPKFLDPVVQKYGIMPSFYFLFELR